jgi:transcription initiation factor TFIID subunit 2
MFAQPVDPVASNLPQYFTLIHRPMDLGTVRAKLKENQYDTVFAWKEEMELIWSNSLVLHSKTSILGMITAELQSIFRKAVQHFSDNPDEDWLSKLTAIKDEMNAVSRKPGTVTVKSSHSKHSPSQLPSHPKDPAPAKSPPVMPRIGPIIGPMSPT